MTTKTRSSSAPVILSHTALRGLAALYVLMFHLVGDRPPLTSFGAFFQWGRQFVDLFFVLSGFVLNWVYFSDDVPINWPSYFRARAARVLPLYYLTTCLFAPLIIYSFLKHGTSYIGPGFQTKMILNAFLVSGIVGGPGETINFPAWSIGVEFLCYVALFPVFVYARRLLKPKRYGAFVQLISVVGLSFCITVWYSLPRISIYHWNWDPNWLLHGVLGFSIGFLLCTLYQESPAWRPSVKTVNLVLLASLILFLLIEFGVLPGDLILCVIPLCVFCCVTDKGIAISVLKTNALQWLGERSYSVYLWHALCKNYCEPFLQARMSQIPYSITILALILVISDLSYRFFECPCRDFLRNFRQRATRVSVQGVPIA